MLPAAKPMILLDTNIVIYLQKPQHAALRARLAHKEFAVSLITKLESLGFYKIEPDEKLGLETMFGAIPVLELSEELIDRAIALAQKTRIQAADAIIAATALQHNMELWTNNYNDFRKVEGLKVKDMKL